MENNEPHWASTILYSLAWLVCCLLVIVDILSIREAALDIVTAIQVQRIANAPEGTATQERLNTGFTAQAIDQGMLFFGGVVAVVFAIAIEYYFRSGQKIGRLWQRIGGVFGVLVAIFIVCVIVQTVV